MSYYKIEANLKLKVGFYFILYIKHNHNYNTIMALIFYPLLMTNKGVSVWKIILRAIPGLNSLAKIFLL